MQRIVFFTAGPTATADELTAIGKLNTAAEKPYEVLVANGVANGDTVPATGTGTTATLVIANGVVTGVTLA